MAKGDLQREIDVLKRDLEHIRRTADDALQRARVSDATIRVLVGEIAEQRRAIARLVGEAANARRAIATARADGAKTERIRNASRGVPVPLPPR